MTRSLKELDRLDARATSGRRTHSRAGRPSVGTLAAVMVTVVLTGVVVLYNPMTGGRYLREALGLGHRQGLVEVRHAGGQYAFVRTQPGSRTPVSYDPCASIHYVVNPAGGPADWAHLVDSAIDRVSSTTGFRFVADGQTDEHPFTRHNSSPHGPVVIGWQTTDENEDLAGEVAGVGGSIAIENRPGHLTYVTGDVALDADWFREMDGEDNRFAAERAVLLHELGHVVGLAHVSSKDELMYKSANRSDFGSGDLEGLARLGSIACG